METPEKYRIYYLPTKTDSKAETFTTQDRTSYLCKIRSTECALCVSSGKYIVSFTLWVFHFTKSEKVIEKVKEIVQRLSSILYLKICSLNKISLDIL